MFIMLDHNDPDVNGLNRSFETLSGFKWLLGLCRLESFFNMIWEENKFITLFGLLNRLDFRCLKSEN